MAKGNYIGGGTVFGPRDAHWYGDGDPTKPDGVTPAKTKRLWDPAVDAKDLRGKVGRGHDALVRVEPPVLNAAIEGRIATLRRDVKMFESQVRAANALLVGARGDLKALLEKYGLPPEPSA